MFSKWFISKKRLLKEIDNLKKEIETINNRLDIIDKVIKLKPSYRVVNGRVELI